METERICPNCRKPLPPDVPLGLCPECLIKSGFPTGTEPGTGGIGRFVPPPVEEIAKLFPQFEIISFIGKGGMGAVYKARQPALDRFVALKILPPAVASDPGFAERFNREARALARLNHPNIVVVYDFGKAGALHYLVMEFVDGTNLREVEQAGRLTSDQALAIVPQICEALQFAHNEGIVHRDIKPENLLLDKKGRVKIGDFGIAKILDVATEKVALTGAKDVMGTPHYMAPEQIEKPQTVDHRADIYSLGVVFYEMLTGELPLGKFAPPSKKVQVDVRLDEVVLHTLEKEPERRYQQASQVKTDVETIAAKGAGAIAGAAPPISPATAQEKTSDKILLPTFLLAFFFGVFGAHRFYVGKIGTGIAQLFTLGGLGIWTTIDWILILCQVFTDGKGRRITNWWHASTSPPKPPKPPKAPKPIEPPVPPVAGSNLFGDAFGGASPMMVAPAVALMVAGFIKLFGGLVILLIGWPGGGMGQFLMSRAGVFSPFHDEGALFSGGIVLFTLVPAVAMIYGATEMIRCRNYAWAITASAVGIVFCSTLGLPAGIWALVVLLLPNVRDRFANPPVLLTREKWLRILGGTAAVGMLFFLMIGLVRLLQVTHVNFGSPASVSTRQVDNPTQPEPVQRPDAGQPSSAPVTAGPAPTAGVPMQPEPMPSRAANPAAQPGLPVQVQPVQQQQPVEQALPVQQMQPVQPAPWQEKAAPAPPAPEMPELPATPAAPAPGEMASPTPQPDAQKQMLEFQLDSARMELTNVEAQYSLGMATSADVDSAKDKVEILQAELSDDSVQVAEIKLDAARRMLDQKTQLQEIGRASAEEVEKAKSELYMAQAQLREAQAQSREAQAVAREKDAQARAAGSQPSFTVAASGTAPLTYQWYMTPTNSSQPSAALPSSGAPGYTANTLSAPGTYPVTIADTDQSATNSIPIPTANSYQENVNENDSKPDASADSVHETDDIGNATDFSRIFHVEPGGKLTMNVDRGDVHITGADQNTVEIHVKRDVNGESDDSEDAKKILKEEHVVLRQAGNEISITAQNPPGLNAVSPFGRHPNLSVHYEITVPRKFEVHSETAGGDVSVTTVEDDVSIKTLGGTLICRDIGGDLEGQTLGGDVHATECKGGLQLDAMGGSITIDGFIGPEVHAATSGGSVSANFAAAPRSDCELRAMGGNVTVRLPGSAAVMLDGHAHGGSVQTDFPVKIENGFGNDSVNGVVNGGGPLLKMSTEGGNIDVLRR